MHPKNGPDFGGFPSSQQSWHPLVKSFLHLLHRTGQAVCFTILSLVSSNMAQSSSRCQGLRWALQTSQWTDSHCLLLKQCPTQRLTRKDPSCGQWASSFIVLQQLQCTAFGVDCCCGRASEAPLVGIGQRRTREWSWGTPSPVTRELRLSLCRRLVFSHPTRE